jgi:hypothetical protein
MQLTAASDCNFNSSAIPHDAADELHLDDFLFVFWVIFHFGTSTPKYSILGKIFRFGHSGKFQYSI